MTQPFALFSVLHHKLHVICVHCDTVQYRKSSLSIAFFLNICMICLDQFFQNRSTVNRYNVNCPFLFQGGQGVGGLPGSDGEPGEDVITYRIKTAF